MNQNIFAEEKMHFP